MKVLHVHAGNLMGGIETFLITLASQRHLCPEIDPHYALFFPGALQERLTELEVPVHSLGEVRVSRPWTVLRARSRFGDLLAKHEYDIVAMHSCWSHAMVAPVAKQRGLPVVFWGHDILTGTHWLERWARRTKPDHIIANSQGTRTSLQQTMFSDVPSEVIYLPVPPWPTGDRAAIRRNIRQELNTPKDAAVIIIAARMERWKGHADLLEALGQLQDLPSWRCWIAGKAQRRFEQAYVAELREQTNRLGIQDRVQFLGHRRDIGEVLMAADIHCQPNRSPEPFGITFIEAMYAGLPVVTTALGGPTEIVKEKCGVLVPFGNTNALANELRRLIENPDDRCRLGSKGLVRAVELCDPACQFDRIHETLTGAVARKTGRLATARQI